MKKIFTLLVLRCLPLLLLLFIQLPAWAMDAVIEPAAGNTGNIFTRPWIWIATGVIVTIKLLGPFSESSKDFVVVRKKTGGKKVTK